MKNEFFSDPLEVRPWRALGTNQPVSHKSQLRDWNFHFWLAHALKPIHFLNAYDNSYSKMTKEHKYKDKDDYKDIDKDKDA